MWSPFTQPSAIAGAAKTTASATNTKRRRPGDFGADRATKGKDMRCSLVRRAAIMAAFGLPLAPEQRLIMYFPIGLTIFGVFGSFTYYLPELFPTRLRGTGAGFCCSTEAEVQAIIATPARIAMSFTVDKFSSRTFATEDTEDTEAIYGKAVPA